MTDPYEALLARLADLEVTRPDQQPRAVISDTRRAGDEERRNKAVGAAMERAGWVRAIYVCQAFAALRGAK